MKVKNVMDKPWEGIDYREVCELYNKRVETHRILLERFNEGDVTGYVGLALGVDDKCGNYSASRRLLGPKILARSTMQKVFALAKGLVSCQPSQLVETIYGARLPYLKISVGSEMAMMLCPDTHWVANRRTLWSHFVLKYKGDTPKANRVLLDSLGSIRDSDEDPEMEYQIWRYLHPDIESNLRELASLGTQVASARSIEPGGMTFLWADAVADTMYNEFGPG